MTHKPDTDYYKAKIEQAERSSDELLDSLVITHGREEGERRFRALTNKAFARSGFKYKPKLAHAG